MPLPSFGAGDRAGRESHVSPAEAKNRGEPSLLDEALAETLALASGGTALDSVELAPFVQVARRHRGRPLTLEPVAVDLALAVLEHRFSQAGFKHEVLQVLARQVAQRLLDDPRSRGWLETFWTQINEAA
jgi:hypothetical protein